jgi:uncharacterized damage-inducible protein DinB
MKNILLSINCILISLNSIKKKYKVSFRNQDQSWKINPGGLTIQNLKVVFVFALFFIVSANSALAQSEIKQEWASFEQEKDASFLKTKVKFKLSASARVVSEDTTSWAGLWVRVDNKDGGSGFFDNMNDRQIKLKEWKTYTIEGEMDENSQRIHFGGFSLGNGKFYFDDFILLIQNDKGKMQQVPVENSGFETPPVDNEIPHWIQGISSGQPVRVKGFSFSTSPENATGNYSLLIEGKGVQIDSSYFITPQEGFSPHIGVLVSMLNNLSSRVETQVSMLHQKEIDFLLDDKANTIGALVMHLAASEKLFQLRTFENRGFTEEEKNKWQVAFDLGDEARKEFIGHDIEYYLEIYRQVRQKTIQELQKRNDEWLLKTYPGELTNNYYYWFHVMEHQSSHLGQILLMKKRLPKKEEPIPKQKLNKDW